MKDNRSLEDKKKEILKHLASCYAIKTIACRKVLVGRTQFYEWLKQDQEFALKVAEIEESFIDYAETRLIEMIGQGDRSALMFYLKAKAKNRGYS